MNWIKDFVNLDGWDLDQLIHRFTLSTAEVEGIEYKGKDVKDLFEIIARRGGEGVSKQVEVKIGKDGKAYGLKINGEKIDDSRLYTIATIDYIANGNDELIPFKNSVSRTDLDLRLRDVMLQYIADKTAKGEKLKASLDNRLIQEK